MHSIPRDQWESRFRSYMVEAAGFDLACPIDVEILEAELSWWNTDLSDGNWLDYDPEEAAQENLSCWSE